MQRHTDQTTSEVPVEVTEHVETIAKHEQAFLARRSLAERFADRVASFAGRIAFVILHLAAFAAWVFLNRSGTRASLHFDPYPYPLFDTVVALEAILLASFILMRQTSFARRADEREHLMLQVLLLTEKEVSALVRINQEMADRLGIYSVSGDERITEMARPTPIDEIALAIQEKLSGEKME